MKHLLCASQSSLAGCAGDQQRLTDQAQYQPDGSRSYSHEAELKTGRQTPGEALGQDDPTVTISRT